MVTFQELIASPQLPDVSKQRLQEVMQQIGSRCRDKVDDIVGDLPEVDLEKAAALAKLDPPLTPREKRALLQKTQGVLRGR